MLEIKKGDRIRIYSTGRIHTNYVSAIVEGVCNTEIKESISLDSTNNKLPKIDVTKKIKRLSLQLGNGSTITIEVFEDG